jgi:2-dehydropantoate 2-reductase
MKITIWGAGAIGGSLGAFLTKAGYDITLVDIVPEHVRVMQQQGLRVSGARGDERYAVKALLASEVTEPLETVFLCVKGHFTDAAMQQIAPLLSPDGYVVSIQNGLNEEIIARYVGEARTVGCFVHFGADYVEPGHILYSNDQNIYLGELDGTISQRIKDLQAILGTVMPTQLTSNIFGYLWGKLVYASMAFVVSSVDAPVDVVMADPRGLKVSMAASAEAARVATALGYSLEMIGSFDPNAFVERPGWEAGAAETLQAMANEMGKAIKNHMGIWMDLKIKRRATEVDMQCGPTAQRGRELGIPTPVNDAVIALIHEIERGERGMSWDNLDVLMESVPAAV